MIWKKVDRNISTLTYTKYERQRLHLLEMEVIGVHASHFDAPFSVTIGKAQSVSCKRVKLSS